MNFESIISHMNDHHKSNLVDLCKKFGGIGQVQDVFLKSVDFNGLDLVYNDKENLRIEFPKKTSCTCPIPPNFLQRSTKLDL